MGFHIFWLILWTCLVSTKCYPYIDEDSFPDNVILVLGHLPVKTKPKDLVDERVYQKFERHPIYHDFPIKRTLTIGHVEDFDYETLTEEKQDYRKTASDENCIRFRKKLQRSINSLLDWGRKSGTVNAGFVSQTDLLDIGFHHREKRQIIDIAHMDDTDAQSSVDKTSSNTSLDEQLSENFTETFLTDFQKALKKFRKILLNNFEREPEMGIDDYDTSFFGSAVLLKLVKKTMKYLAGEYAHNKHYMLVVAGGVLDDFYTKQSDGSKQLEEVVKHLYESSKKYETLIVVTGIFRCDNSHEEIPLFSTGPGSARFEKAKYVWQVPNIIRSILSEKKLLKRHIPYFLLDAMPLQVPPEDEPSEKYSSFIDNEPVKYISAESKDPVDSKILQTSNSINKAIPSINVSIPNQIPNTNNKHDILNLKTVTKKDLEVNIPTKAIGNNSESSAPILNFVNHNPLIDGVLQELINEKRDEIYLINNLDSTVNSTTADLLNTKAVENKNQEDSHLRSWVNVNSDIQLEKNSPLVTSINQYHEIYNLSSLTSSNSNSETEEYETEITQPKKYQEIDHSNSLAPSNRTENYESETKYEDALKVRNINENDTTTTLSYRQKRRIDDNGKSNTIGEKKYISNFSLHISNIGEIPKNVTKYEFEAIDDSFRNNKNLDTEVEIVSSGLQNESITKFYEDNSNNKLLKKSNYINQDEFDYLYTEDNKINERENEPAISKNKEFTISESVNGVYRIYDNVKNEMADHAFGDIPKKYPRSVKEQSNLTDDSSGVKIEIIIKDSNNKRDDRDLRTLQGEYVIDNDEDNENNFTIIQNSNEMAEFNNPNNTSGINLDSLKGKSGKKYLDRFTYLNTIADTYVEASNISENMSKLKIAEDKSSKLPRSVELNAAHNISDKTEVKIQINIKNLRNKREGMQNKSIQDPEISLNVEEITTEPSSVKKANLQTTIEGGNLDFKNETEIISNLNKIITSELFDPIDEINKIVKNKTEMKNGLDKSKLEIILTAENENKKDGNGISNDKINTITDMLMNNSKTFENKFKNIEFDVLDKAINKPSSANLNKKRQVDNTNMHGLFAILPNSDDSKDKVSRKIPEHIYKKKKPETEVKINILFGEARDKRNNLSYGSDDTNEEDMKIYKGGDYNNIDITASPDHNLEFSASNMKIQKYDMPKTSSCSETKCSLQSERQSNFTENNFVKITRILNNGVFLSKKNKRAVNYKPVINIQDKDGFNEKRVNSENSNDFIHSESEINKIIKENLEKTPNSKDSSFNEKQVAPENTYNSVVSTINNFDSVVSEINLIKEILEKKTEISTIAIIETNSLEKNNIIDDLSSMETKTIKKERAQNSQATINIPLPSKQTESSSVGHTSDDSITGQKFDHTNFGHTGDSSVGHTSDDPIVNHKSDNLIVVHTSDDSIFGMSDESFVHTTEDSNLGHELDNSNVDQTLSRKSDKSDSESKTSRSISHDKGEVATVEIGSKHLPTLYSIPKINNSNDLKDIADEENHQSQIQNETKVYTNIVKEPIGYENQTSKSTTMSHENINSKTSNQQNVIKNYTDSNINLYKTMQIGDETERKSPNQSTNNSNSSNKLEETERKTTDKNSSELFEPIDVELKGINNDTDLELDINSDLNSYSTMAPTASLSWQRQEDMSYEDSFKDDIKQQHFETIQETKNSAGNFELNFSFFFFIVFMFQSLICKRS